MIIHIPCVKKIGAVRIMRRILSTWIWVSARSQLQFVVTDSTYLLINGCCLFLLKILLDQRKIGSLLREEIQINIGSYFSYFSTL